MTNSNNEVLRKIRDVIEKGGNIDVNTRDVLLFSAILDIYEKLDKGQIATQESIEAVRKETAIVREETKPAVAFYKVGIWIAGVAGVSIIAFIGGLLTGQIEVIFR